MLLLVLGGVGLFFWLKDDDSSSVATSTSTVSVTSSEETTEESTEETTEEETTEESTEESTDPSEPTPETGPPPPAGAAAPTGSGDAAIDEFSANCFAGDMAECDSLYFAARNPDDQGAALPGLEAFFDYGYNCGQRLPDDEIQDRKCVDIWPDA